METRCGGKRRIKVFKTLIALIIILTFSFSFLFSDKSAWAQNSSLYFDSSTYVSVPSTADLQPASQVTLEAWAYANDYSDSYRTIISKGYTGIYGLRLERTSSGNRALFEVRTTSGWTCIFTPTGVPRNQWFHIAGVYDGSKLYIYINGSLVASEAWSGTLIPNSLNITIGRNNDNRYPEYWYGYIDEVRIWNVARTQAEIQQNMNHELSGSEPGLVAYWNMNEGSGTIVYDLASNHDGTIRGNVLWSDGAPVSQLNAPSNLQATVDGKTVTLTWNGQDSIMTFIIERSNDGQTWGQVAEVTEKTCQDTVPSWETIYYYRVLAKNSDGMISEPSETAQAVIPAIPEPTGLTANVSGNTINLSWTGVKGISTYRIERSQNGILWSDLIEVNSTSYQDKDLAWETKYYYRVRAVDGDQVSKPSETVSAETPVPPAPEAPRITYIVDNTNVEMSWNYQRNCDGYKVYINNSLAAELPSSKTNYSFTGERGKSYTVVIEAYNAYGKASSSITVNISEMPTPGARTMAGDVLKYTGAVVASTGGLLALGLALKGSGGLIAIIRMFLGR